MAKKKIRGNWGILLSYIGKLYRNPADALKEYVSNALDEWGRARNRGEMEGACEVTYSLEMSKITIDYNSPGMDEKEFEAALNKVAESAKPGLGIPQIGELGIGIFAFNQVGSTCTFYSKKAKGMPTIKVVLTGNSDDYDIDTAIKRESLENPGMKVVITRLHQDPTKPRGSLAPRLLERFFAEKFDPYLRQGNLKIAISCGGKAYEVKPLEIIFPVVGEAFKEWRLSTDRQKKFNCQFWFDSSGKSHVSIRHTGVSIIEDLKTYPSYGLEESIYASGSLKGYIDADFLKPQPSRTSFEENQDWIRFLTELDKIRPSLEAEVEELRREEEEKKLTEVQKKAIEMAREILGQDQFQDLVPLGGLRKPRGQVIHPGVTHPPGQITGKRSKEEGKPGHLGGPRISYVEDDFDGPSRHSEFIAGTVRVNKRNDDYIREEKGSAQQMLAYAMLMIGKEAVAHSDSTGKADHSLEKLLSYLFQVQLKTRKVELKELKLKEAKKPKTPKGQRKGKSAKGGQLKLIMSDTETSDET
jgi:hypothetical protein